MIHTAKVIVLCGRICSGKSTYAQKLRKEMKAVVLSVDEITLALLGGEPGEMLGDYVEKLEAYLYEKSKEIIETGINVILDIGLWQKAERDYTRKFYDTHDIDCEIHYLDISDEEWERRIAKRNNNVKAGKENAYYVDDRLKKKVESIFERPEKSEVDVIVNS